MKVDKDKISKVIFDSLMVFEPLSVTLVGSITVSDDISVVSDIDTVVIVENLSKDLFDRICQKVGEIDTEDLGLSGFSLNINSTFGPLKFDKPKTAVIHLMVYDLAGHIDHVLKSPFTSYDWERSSLFYGKSLREVYPVIGLQPKDFIQARRGLANYIKDLQKGSISYREYHEVDGALIQKVKELNVDAKHKGEFAYHIVRNLIFNYVKMVRKENVLYSDDEFYSHWKKYCSGVSYFIEGFMALKRLKLERAERYPEGIIEKVQVFVKKFTEMIEAKIEDGIQLKLIRHAKTELNDGSFLGQGRDPGILTTKSNQLSESGEVFSSSAKRALETCQMLFPHIKCNRDQRLLEINYGEAEGLTFSELNSQYPELIKDWSEHKDARFPSGENSQDVLDRFLDFLSTEIQTKSNSIISHNVVIRNAIAYSLGLPIYIWYILPIGHLEVYKLIKNEDGLFVDLDAHQKMIISDTLKKALNG